MQTARFTVDAVEAQGLESELRGCECEMIGRVETLDLLDLLDLLDQLDARAAIQRRVDEFCWNAEA